MQENAEAKCNFTMGAEPIFRRKAVLVKQSYNRLKDRIWSTTSVRMSSMVQQRQNP